MKHLQKQFKYAIIAVFSLICLFFAVFVFAESTEIAIYAKELSRDKISSANGEYVNLECENSYVQDSDNFSLPSMVNSDIGRPEQQYDDNVYETSPESVSSVANTNTAVTSATSTGDTYIEGVLQWKDDNDNIHALRRVKVSVYDSNMIGSTLLGTVFTDHSGNYELAFTNDTSIFENGRDLYIRVYAGTSNVLVYQSDGSSEYYWESGKEDHQNVSTGSTTEINKIFDMSSNLGKAMQISQAALTARDFAWSLTGNMPEDVKIIYPHSDSGCSYSIGSKTIRISNASADAGFPEAYASWDVIMHEYGHHMQYEMDITNSPNGKHFSSENDIDARKDKSEGIRLAWGESWPTVFAFVAQNYYQEYLTNIDAVNGPEYESYNGLSYNLESNNIKLGEGCERSIMSVLWDLFDVSSDTDSLDSINLGFQKWWDITTISGTYTFSDFIQNFYTEYPELKGEIGKNLTYYGMAPSIYNFTPVQISPNMSPLNISWAGQGGSNRNPNNSFQVVFFSQDFTQAHYVDIAANTFSYQITSSIFETIKTFNGEKVYVGVIGYQTDSPATGGYISKLYEFTKKVYIIETSGNEVILTGTYCDLIGQISFPKTIDGYTITTIGDYALSNLSFTSITFANDSQVTKIEEYAFYGNYLMDIVNLPDSIEEIGQYAFAECGMIILSYEGTAWTEICPYTFYNTTLPFNSTIWESVEVIGDYAFYNSEFSDEFILSKNDNIVEIGEKAFANAIIQSIIIPENIIEIGNNAFEGCTSMTIYTEYYSRPSSWSSSWNSSNRPVIWGCTLSESNSYVISFLKSYSNPSNASANNGILNPIRSGYNFNGWYTSADFTGTAYENIASAPNTTLYAKWTEKSCVTEGTLITLADGSQVAVEDLTGNEMLLVWNMYTGSFDVAPILFIDCEPISVYNVIVLTFSDGTEVQVIDEHAFWDIDLNKYIFLREDAAKYIGDYFNKQIINENGDMDWLAVQLVDVEIIQKTTTAWSPVTYGHLCYYVNGMLSMPGGTEGLINIFDVDSAMMKYDEENMQEDLEEYGQFTYEEFAEIYDVPETIFNAFNGQYLKVSMGKGLITQNDILNLILRYSEFFN